MKGNQQGEREDANHTFAEGKDTGNRQVPGKPGSFDQPTPRDEVMPRQGGRPTHQTPEVPLGTGNVPEPPGGGGLPSRRVPHTGARERSEN